MAKVFGITGWKNSGKTTLVARLVSEFTNRGLRVSTVKNASHDFTLDHEGTDTFQHRKAGAHEVAICGGSRWAIMHENAQTEERSDLDTMLARLSPCDLVLVEGFKTSVIPKIQTMRLEAREATAIWESNESIVGVAADHDVDVGDLAFFELDNVVAIADFVLAYRSET